MQRYVPISREEMEETLHVGQYFMPVESPGGWELVYEWKLPNPSGGEPWCAIRVFSSVVPGEGSRDVGEDAIRTVLVHLQDHLPLCASVRNYRTKNWRKHLSASIRALYERATKLQRCQYCQKWLRYAEVKSGKNKGRGYLWCADRTCQDQHGGGFRAWEENN